MAANPVLVAIDTPDRARAEQLIQAVGTAVGGVKLGLEFFAAQGPAGIRAVTQERFTFLDLKLHDIPNTVAGAVRSLTPLGADLLTIHAGGGAAMLEAARQAAWNAAAGGKRLKLIGVTVLTSFDDSDLAPVGQLGPVGQQVLKLAKLAQSCGLDGAVCSPREVAALRAACGPDFILVVPGIRPEGTALDDQKRAMTPPQALAAGATHLVIGRPITGADDPGAAARAIAASLGC